MSIIAYNMSIYELKSRFQDTLRPVSDGLVELGVTANQVTISAIILSAGTAYVIAHLDQCSLTNEPSPSTPTPHKIWWILPAALFIRMALNAIDGMMAREHHQASTAGAILNEAGDILSDSLLIASLAPQLNHHRGHYKLSERRHLQLINRLSTLTELMAIVSSLTTKQRANHGPLGKSDRAVVLGIIGAAMALNLPRKISNARQNQRYVRPILWLNELLLIKTCVNRMSFIVKHYATQAFEKRHPAPIPI